MAGGTWNPQYTEKEKEYLETIIIDNVDRPLKLEEYPDLCNTFAALFHRPCSVSRMRRMLAATAKGLGVKRKKGGYQQKKGAKEKAIHLELSIGEEIDNILSSARCKILKIIKKRVNGSEEELDRVKKELREKTERLKALTKIRQAVEDYKG